MEKNEDIVKIRGGNDMLPLHAAAQTGVKEIVEHLYETMDRDGLVNDNDRFELLVSLINHGLYDVALDLVEKHPELATKRGNNEETALHYLARMPVPTPTFSGGPVRRWKRLVIYTWAETPQAAIELIECLWKQVMLLDDSQILNIIRKPWPLTFEAAKQGNLAFLNIILGAYPDLVFEVDENHYSIFHFAVMYRQLNIFNIIYDIGSFKDLLVQKTDKKRNNILHLAAKIPGKYRHHTESGNAAVQLKEELLWFKVHTPIPLFCATMFIVFQHGMLWVPVLITTMAVFACFVYCERLLRAIVDVTHPATASGSPFKEEK
ncbi:hypothetical protein Pint_22282 [Pistacia integerrima]|uniref:Uncharacterized protein n=1 Tax=Pistacia integerrima TaxID=434235 RepID=A0ACC0YKQ2_9ROSI|nr:hypothetical protein Pint_22282 [Pistacia integerrima]